MRFLQTVTFKLICLALLIVGVLLVVTPSSQLYGAAVAWVDSVTSHPNLLRVALGVLGLAVAVWGLIPIPRTRRSGKTITYPDAQGSTTVRLDSIETTLKKEISQHPNVKKINLLVEPADENRRVRIEAGVVLNKAPGDSTRDISAQLKSRIAEEMRNILGPDEVVSVDLTIEGFAIKRDKKGKAKIEEASLSLERDDEEPEDKKNVLIPGKTD